MKPTRRRVEIVDVTRHQLELLTSAPVTFPVIAFAGIISRRQRRRRKRTPRLVAIGGLCWRFIAEGASRPRCDIWLETLDATALQNPAAARLLVRMAKRMLRTAQQFGEPAVYCLRDDLPNSAKLLSLAGLRPAGEVPIVYADGTTGTGELFEWRPLQRSAPS